MFGLEHDCLLLSPSCQHLKPYIHRDVESSVLQRFDDGEMAAIVPPVKGLSVLYLASMAGYNRPAHDYLIEVCVTLRAIRQAGARNITIGLVYGAYTRQSDDGALMYNLLSVAGADDVWIMDPHVLAMPPVQTLTMMPVFAKDMGARFKDRPLIVAPDRGGVARASMVAELVQSDMCILHKQRSEDCVGVKNVEGASPKGRVCIIVDDIVQSGCTLVAASNYLKKQGASEVHAYATHNLTKPCTADMLAGVLASICTSNSIYHEVLPDSWVVLPLIFS